MVGKLLGRAAILLRSRLKCRRSRLLLHQENRAGHFADQFVVTASEQEVFQMAFFMGKHDDEVDIHFLDQGQLFPLSVLPPV